MCFLSNSDQRVNSPAHESVLRPTRGYYIATPSLGTYEEDVKATKFLSFAIAEASSS